MMPWYWYAATGLFGAAVGGCELIGRYRDAPFEAMRNPAAMAYIAINAAASMLAYAVILTMDWRFGVSAVANR